MMRKFYLELFATFTAVLLSFYVNAQPGCPAVNAGNNVTLPCGVSCANLTATSFPSGNTTSYSVASFPYSNVFSYTTGTSILVNQDDIWSGVINLPFTFCFFGNAYTQLIVGANGLISFDISRANQFCQWNTSSGATFPTTAYPETQNSIMGVYHDIDPSLGGNIRYQIVGTAPCRIFVVSWRDVPMFDDVFLIGSCFNVPHAFHQIAIYETTNVIEVYVQNKSACTGWNNGYATLGIQNAAGTVAYTPPGYNNSVWNAQNQAWRFTPNGPSIVSIDWLQGGNVVGTGNTYSACPTNTTTYTARATYLPCNGGTPVVVTDDVVVTPNSTFQARIDSSRNVGCNGSNNGAAYASVSGGLPPVTYGWSNGSTQLTLTGLSPGTYIFTAQDGSGCIVRDTAIITQAPPLTANVPSVSQTNCSGSGTGTLIATASGGVPSYTFAWSSNPAQNDSILDNVLPGTYTITVTDASACTVTASGTLTIQAGGNNVTLNPPVITNVSCFGGNNGSITASASGGSGVFTYNWSNSQSGATISSLSQGAYTVTANDGAGCTASATYNVTQPTQLTLNAPNITNIGCGGASATGSVTANPAGGSPAYSYSWVRQGNGQTFSGQTINGLQADTYNLTVTDLNNCSITASYVVSAVAPLVFNQSQVNVTCNGGSDGSATITVTSGTAPYQYNWNGAGNTANSTLGSLSAGTVNVTVSDVNCSGTATFAITEPTAIIISNPQVTNVTCNTGNNGSITIAVNGGTGTLTPNWSNGTNNATSINNLTAGNYTVTVTDQSNCSVTASYTVTEPAALILNAPNITNLTCTPGSTGAITANAIGGTGTYTYSWTQLSNSQTLNGQTISNLQPDTYSLTVTDQNNCSATATYQVTQPVTLTISTSQINVTCNGGSDGSATVTVNTGTAPYQYNWNGTGNTPNNSLNNLSAGTVSVTVSDVNCSLTATFTITEPAAIVVTPSGNTSASCNGSGDGTLSITVSGGTPSGGAQPYTYQWNDPQGQTTPTAVNLNAGTYSVVVTDGSGCTQTATYTVTEPAPVTANATTQDATCFAAPNGSATVTANGGTTPYTYLWSDGQTSATATALYAGPYLVTVTDVNGCTATAAVSINEPTDMIISATTTQVKCIGDKNGTITVQANGGTPPYNFSATQDFANFFFATNGVIIDLAPGVYTVIVADNNGCTKTLLATVPDATPDNFVTSTDSTSCYGSDYNDGAAYIFATSIQNGPYEFGMDGGALQFSGDFYNLSAGPHVITAVNVNGCVSEVPVVVFEPLPIIVDVIPDTVVLPLGEGQPVNVVYQNAGNNVVYTWEPWDGLSCGDCPTPIVTAYKQGDYIITVSTQNGSVTCFGSATLHVDVLPEQPVFIPNAFTPNGDGNNDVFAIYGQGISTIDLKIFNRWGELIYESNNQFSGWDGTYKGVLQNPSVFTYDARITYLNGKRIEKSGTVTLVR